MKRFLLLFVVLFFSISAFSQILLSSKKPKSNRNNLINLDTIKVNIICVIPHTRFMSNRQVCKIDYGQKIKFFKRKEKVRTELGDKKKFNSDAAIINYFSEQSWVYIDFDGYALIFHRKAK